MPHNRFFSPFSSFSSTSDSITIQNIDELHHIRTVMKCREGDTVEIINGTGGLIVATIQKITKYECSLLINTTTQSCAPLCHITIGLGITRASHLEWALEKCTEIGASQFFLFAADCSEKIYFTDAMQRRLSHIVQSAIKQSGRVYLPQIKIFSSLHEAVLQAPSPIFFAHTISPAVPLYQKKEEKKVGACLQATIFIGPEKGWSRQEQHFFSNSFSNHIISLSDETLRAETAAIIGCHEIKKWLEQQNAVSQ